MSLLIKNGRIIDPANGVDAISDLYIEDGKIREAGIGLSAAGAEVIDAEGLIVCPGFIDMHVHLREPGREDKETIVTCSRAAARGGFTSIVGMPNTTPNADDQTVIGYVAEKARRESIVNIYPVGSMTKGRNSKEMSQVGDLVKAGAVAVSDDGNPVKDTGLMYKCLQYLQKWKIPYISHSEDLDLSGDGIIHEGAVSTELGVPGKPPESEAVCVAREIILAQGTNTPVHFTHVSAKQSVELIRDAKRKGIKVTCDTCPHYFSLTDSAVRGYNPNAKMNPPLRSKDHMDAVIKGLADGTIDAISTEHAPHLLVEKFLEFDKCENGIVGLETSVPLAMTKLFAAGILEINQLVEKYTVNPANILGLNKGTLSNGADADITIIDPNKEEIIKKEEFESKGRNTPFDGWNLKGIPAYTIVGGRIVMRDRKIL